MAIVFIFFFLFLYRLSERASEHCTWLKSLLAHKPWPRPWINQNDYMRVLVYKYIYVYVLCNPFWPMTVPEVVQVLYYTTAECFVLNHPFTQRSTRSTYNVIIYSIVVFDPNRGNHFQNLVQPLLIILERPCTVVLWRRLYTVIRITREPTKTRVVTVIEHWDNDLVTIYCFVKFVSNPYCRSCCDGVVQLRVFFIGLFQSKFNKNYRTCNTKYNIQII